MCKISTVNVIIIFNICISNCSILNYCVHYFVAPLIKLNLCRHDSYGNQYPGQGTPPTGSYPNQQPGMYQQQQVTFSFILDKMLSESLNVAFLCCVYFSEALCWVGDCRYVVFI